ncbi:hypothetical protein [Granulicella aggregans]|uniref:hypothetical protein n=1 Tax=Granulicella aggregans TaxID=474949 RepID=UPI001C845281|nr:hypothetical protein [Granulicella aggregans]
MARTCAGRDPVSTSNPKQDGAKTEKAGVPQHIDIAVDLNLPVWGPIRDGRSAERRP